MPSYRCLIRGENFVSKVDARWKLMGFYTTRWVRAPDPNSAELLVVERLKKEPLFQKPHGYSGGPPAMLYVEEITRGMKPPWIKQGGATWYAMEDS